MKLDTLGLLYLYDKKLSDIAKMQDISLTTINKQIRELKDKDFLNDARKVTPKGINHLQDRKIDNAIILAAGWGSRMSPATDNMPKPLVKINGTPMIEITIKNLIKSGINDITVIVGKEREQFNYLREKFDIKIIFNNEWNKRESIASLEKAKHLLKKTILIEGDAVIYDRNIILNFINDPIFLGCYTEGSTPEWSYKMKGNNIVGIEKGGEDQYTWKGVWYSNNMSSDLYREWFEKEYNNPKFRDVDAANILVKIMKDAGKKLRMFRVKDDSVVECDTFEELCQVDPSYRGENEQK